VVFIFFDLGITVFAPGRHSFRRFVVCREARMWIMEQVGRLFAAVHGKVPNASGHLFDELREPLL